LVLGEEKPFSQGLIPPERGGGNQKKKNKGIGKGQLETGRMPKTKRKRSFVVDKKR